MKKVGIIHGTKGVSTGNWFPWIKKKLSAKGHSVIIPQMPTPVGHSLENWLKTFNAEYGDIDSSSVLIGHSAGAVTILRILEKLTHPISASAFIGGFTGTLNIKEYDDLNESFTREPYDWETIRKNTGHALCFIGDNDPYVPMSQGLEIASGLDIKPHIIPCGGHLNAESGFTEFPALLTELEKLGL